MIKKEMLASIEELSDGEEYYLELREDIRNAKKPKDGTPLIKKCKYLLKGATKKIINIVGKQGKILKRFKEEDDFLIMLA